MLFIRRCITAISLVVFLIVLAAGVLSVWVPMQVVGTGPACDLFLLDVRSGEVTIGWLTPSHRVMTWEAKAGVSAVNHLVPGPHT